ncbi:MAG: hypothetical protein K2X77_26970 [Candidatus Obscuribacterales bacterium]|jgi:hypothetical protein|nr:hypothetical protein [Candidatus Obscuribacterales bacterium]
MQYSKFVNTKANQRGNAKKEPLQFPIFERSKNHNQFQKPPQAELERLAQDQVKTVEIPKPVIEQAPPVEAEPAKEARIHGSVNFEQMQRMEDLTKADEDWLAFFMGKTEPIVYYSQSTELATIPQASFAESDVHGPIIPPAPAAPIQELIEESEKSENCLNNIFDEMISDDKLFSRSALV